jgi:threonine synthase
MWRYREVLPGGDDPVTLVEGFTPLVEVDDGVMVKDEARNPTP